MSKQTMSNDTAFSEMDMYLFGQGTHYEIYKKLGSHFTEEAGICGVRFSVWAPHAKAVYLIGEFNGWDETKSKMTRLDPIGIYTIFIPEAEEGQLYKYLIYTADGRTLYKADPFASYAELRPGTASRIFDIDCYQWKDAKWIEKRSASNIYERPISIYEVHLGSWRKHTPCTETDGFYSYREMAEELSAYVKEMGYTHIELIGVAEHPFDGSWGYQVTGYYAPTSRYGTPEDFKYFVDYMHKKGIGIILDWVPAHFPKDAHGLAEFDGEALFEYADSRMGEHPDWGTKIFDFSKNEVRNFLIANALYWIGEFHIDGLRVDAVASMLYLDYGKKDGEWLANKYGGNQNLDAIELFRHVNSIVQRKFSGVMMIAEESTAWPMVTGDPADGGLGFTYKWNMGWMHDFLDYMKLDPYFRKDNHNKMTFAMSYNGAENYILVLSHDEVVHLKCSMLNKMPGYFVDKFANLRVGYTFMTGHPGKKLLFMGQEFGQLQEWSEKRPLDWYLLEEEPHKGLQAFVRDLLHIYSKYPALYEMDHEDGGFRWINADDAYRSIYSFVRYSRGRKRDLLFVCNFTPMEYADYRVGVPKKKRYKLILDGDDKKYGGNGNPHESIYQAETSECDGMPYSFAFKLAPYQAAVFEF